MDGTLDLLKSEEREAWIMFWEYVDFVHRTKKRVYQRKRPLSPITVDEAEKELMSKFHRWEKAREMLLKATLQAYSASQPGAIANPLPLRQQ